MIWLLLGALGSVAFEFWLIFTATRPKWRQAWSDAEVSVMIRFFVPTLVGFLASLLLWLSWGVYTAERIGCRNTATVAGLPWQWSITTGCLVRLDGQWIPLDKWRAITQGQQ